jgi:hypothetical protein
VVAGAGGEEFATPCDVDGELGGVTDDGTADDGTTDDGTTDGTTEGEARVSLEPFIGAEAPAFGDGDDGKVWLGATEVVIVDELAVVELETPLGCVAGVDDEEYKDTAPWLDGAVGAPAELLIVTLDATELVDVDTREFNVVEVEALVEHCKFEDVTKGRTLVPFTTKEASAQSLMLRSFLA